MSAHSLQADICPGCAGRFNFILFHLPHCKNPRRSNILKFQAQMVQAKQPTRGK